MALATKKKLVSVSVFSQKGKKPELDRTLKHYLLLTHPLISVNLNQLTLVNEM
jgi:hypothetical protein